MALNKNPVARRELHRWQYRKTHHLHSEAAVPISWEVVSYDNSVKEKVLGFQGNPGYSWSSE